MRVAPRILLTEQDRAHLETLAGAADTPARVAQRARIVLLAAQGEQNKLIAPRLGIGRAQVARWRERFAYSGLMGILCDLPRGAPPPVKVDVARLALLASGTQGDAPRGRTMRGMASELGVSPASVSRHWRAAILTAAGVPPVRIAGERHAGGPAHPAGCGTEIIGLCVASPADAPVRSLDPGDDTGDPRTGMHHARLQPVSAPPAQPPAAESRSPGVQRPTLPGGSTKVLPPRGSHRLMPREALMGRLLEARRHRCVLIQGQAGSGKTSTLMAWRKAMISLGHDVCWLSLSVEDNEPACFFNYLLASIAEADPGAVAEAAQVLGAECGEYDEAAIELWAITLSQGLARRERDLVLMIDDLHHITDRRILQALQWLLDYAPDRLHLGLTSRTALELSMERLRLQGMLAELDMRDLRFTAEESARFLREQLGSIDSSDAAALHAQTDGWVAGLQLFAIGLRTRQAGDYPVTQVRDARAFASFFEREVLVRLAPDDRDMLTRVAICQRFCAPLCAELLGRPEMLAHIKARIAQMVADHLFITTVRSHDHETWYRIHPLLRETLLAQLAARGEAERRALHAAAWRWFVARGEVDDAVLHAVRAGDADAAAQLVENCAQTLMVRGELPQLASLLRMLPEEQVRQRFGLQVVKSYMQLYARDFDALRESLARMGEQRDAVGASGRYSLTLLRAAKALLLDDTDEAAALLPDIRNAPADADEFSWHARGNVLSWLLTQRGEHDIARAVLDEADLFSRSPRSWLLGRCIHAVGLSREGQIRHAGKIVREVMEEAEARGPGYVGLSAMAAGLLADTLYELNETEAACQLLEPRMAMIEQVALPEVMLRACLVLSDAHWIAGRRGQALARLERLEAYAGRHGLDRLLAEALVVRQRRHLEQGETERANVVFERLQALALRHAGSGPHRSRQTALAATRAGIDRALHTRDFPLALAHIEPLLHAPSADGRGDTAHPLPAVASLRAQAAIARLGLGDAAAARHDFVEAIRVSHRLGLARTLLDIFQAMPEAFDTLSHEPLPEPVLNFHLERLTLAQRAAERELGLERAVPAAGSLATLSEREREILNLLAQAMSNKKIATILNVSAETVKWHLKNIYAKLGVGGRGRAAALLRDTVAPELARA